MNIFEEMKFLLIVKFLETNCHMRCTHFDVQQYWQQPGYKFSAVSSAVIFPITHLTRSSNFCCVASSMTAIASPPSRGPFNSQKYQAGDIQWDNIREFYNDTNTDNKRATRLAILCLWRQNFPGARSLHRAIASRFAQVLEEYAEYREMEEYGNVKMSTQL